ncbi:hypothetical protein ZIOFF_073147 [Zingiber officinale]|uniref:Uncharacterized protein n=1 Tax=Zingiber officinale TaxID=94328 RepID=A0A8J5C6N8_ZINOF|nr:hypothetical protein ZIOFF_073147 [Zingiber officinale]
MGFSLGIKKKSFSVASNGYFVIDLYGECYVDFEYVVYYAPRVSGFLGYDSISNLEGVQIRSYLIWYGVSYIKPEISVPAGSVSFTDSHPERHDRICHHWKSAIECQIKLSYVTPDISSILPEESGFEPLPRDVQLKLSLPATTEDRIPRCRATDYSLTLVSFIRYRITHTSYLRSIHSILTSIQHKRFPTSDQQASGTRADDKSKGKVIEVGLPSNPRTLPHAEDLGHGIDRAESHRAEGRWRCSGSRDGSSVRDDELLLTSIISYCEFPALEFENLKTFDTSKSFDIQVSLEEGPTIICPYSKRNFMYSKLSLPVCPLDTRSPDLPLIKPFCPLGQPFCSIDLSDLPRPLVLLSRSARSVNTVQTAFIAWQKPAPAGSLRLSAQVISVVS